MASQKNTQIIRWTVILSSFIIVALILWNTYDFFQKFKHEERAKMEILAKAYERFSSASLNTDISLEDKIIGNNHNIPMIITNEKVVIGFRFPWFLNVFHFIRTWKIQVY